MVMAAATAAAISVTVAPVVAVASVPAVVGVAPAAVVAAPGGGGGGGGPGGGGGGMGGPGGGGGRGPGGGGGGGRGAGGGGRGMSSAAQGPDFFVDRVTDDPKQAIFFDPQQSTDASSDDNLNPGATSNDSGALLPINYQPPQLGQGPAAEVQAPQRPVQIEALPELGIIVVRSANPQDAKLVEELIEIIRKQSANAEVDIRMVPLEKGDATSIANILTQVFQRVQLTANGNLSTLGAPRQQSTTNPLFNTTQVTTLNQPSSVGLFPIPRQNAILVAAPRSRMEYVISQIKLLDVGIAPGSQLEGYSLTRAGAAKVAQQVNAFWSTKYANEAALQHQIRVTFDDSTNTIFVQAAPADMVEIADFIHKLDTMEPKSTNDVRIIQLTNAVAADLSQLVLKIIGDAIVIPTSPSTTQPTTTGLRLPVNPSWWASGHASDGVQRPAHASPAVRMARWRRRRGPAN